MTTPTQPTWRSHYTLLVLLFVYTMSFIDRQILGILIQPIKTEFDVSDTAMGVLSGLTFALFYGALAIPFGRYADRSNRRNFVAYCCAAWSIMTAFCGMAVGYWTLALARVGVAVGEAGGGPPSISMIADHYPPAQRGRAMSIYMLGPQLGILFGLTMGGWIAQHYGWRSAFLWMSLPGLLAAVMLRYSGTEPTRGNWDAKGSINADAPTESLRVLLTDLLRSQAFKRITLASLLMGFSGYGIGIWTSAFLVRSHGMTLQGAGMVMGLMGGLAAAFGAVASGWLSDRLVKRDPRWRLGVPALGCLLSIPSGLAFYAMPMGEQWQLGPMMIPHAVGFYMCFGFTAVWWAAPVYATLSELVAPHRRSSGVAIFNLGVTMFGGGLGPLAIGMLSDALTPTYGNEALRYALGATTGICFLLGALCFIWAFKPYAAERQVPHALPTA